MSSKRKFQRAQAGKKPDVQKSRTELRRELAEERFAKPGADKLWIGLLGWDAARVERIWMIQTIHDIAKTGDAARGAKLAERLGQEEVDQAVKIWKSSGDEYTPGDPSPKWHYLAANLEGGASASELQEDWEAWTSMRLAAPIRSGLMNALGQGEQAAVALGAMTHSENAAAIVNILRFTWTALAYGDERAFAKLRDWSDEWLKLAAEKS